MVNLKRMRLGLSLAFVATLAVAGPWLASVDTLALAASTSGINGSTCIAAMADTGLSADLSTTDIESSGPILKCLFDISAGAAPASASTISGFSCNGAAGLTTNSTAIVDTNGVVILTCLN